MEVTQLRDHVTHAVIGGLEAESMGISDDPAFYHMLSSTLYSDERKAVIRETLCNGWDAHIEAGRTDTALEITLTSEKLVIKDFGLGIPRHLIKPIYGVYGASTKKTNANVTGGFGLGCKAPFAYVDHFEVISCHEGLKSIYRMSKSSGAVMGKPSIQPIVADIPTTESGITVTMQVKNSSDQHRFHKLIEQIAAQGEMKVNLNGEPIESWPFSQAKHGYMLVPINSLEDNALVHVRYGNVIYPVGENEDLRTRFYSVKRAVDDIAYQGADRYNRQSRYWSVVLMAEPNTISVTPSRESLSMSPRTVETLQALLDNFINTFQTNAQVTTELRRLFLESEKEAVAFNMPSDLLTVSRAPIRLEAIKRQTKELILDPVDTAALRIVNGKTPKGGLWKRIVKERFNAAIGLGYGNRGLIQTYNNLYFKKQDEQKRRFCDGDYSKGTIMPSVRTMAIRNWFQRRVIYPVVEAIKKEPLLDVKNLGIWDSPRYNRDGWGNSNREIDFIPCNRYMVSSLEEMLPFTRGVVILAHSRIAASDRAHRMKEFAIWFGRPVKSLIYLVPRNPKKVAKALELFRSIGLYVVDTTVRQVWDPPEEVLEAEREERRSLAKPKKVRPDGWPTLAGLTTLLNLDSFRSDDAEFTTKPEFVVTIAPTLETLKSFDPHWFNQPDQLMCIIRLFGARGAGVANKIQLEKAIENGASEVVPWVLDRIIEAYKTNPAIEHHYRTSTSHVYRDPKYNLDGAEEHILSYIRRDDTLRKKFKLGARNTQEVRDYLTLYDAFDRYRGEKIEELNKLVKSWIPNDATTKLVAMIQDNEMIKFLDTAVTHYQAKSLPEERQQLLRSMVLTALKGK